MFSKKILFLFIISFLIFTLLFLVWAGSGIYLPHQEPGAQVKFQIKRGEDVFQIAKNLEKNDLISDKLLFEAYVILKGEVDSLQAGHYLLSSSMTVPEIAEKISSGQTITKKITIIEGWSVRDIAFYLESKKLAQAEQLFEIAGFPAVDYSKTKDLMAKDFGNQFDFLKSKPDRVGLEGYLFPDTYQINPNLDIEEIVKKMLANFDQKVTPVLREEIEAGQESIFEIVTMASLLEKEVRTFSDKRLVAGILWKRLKNKIPLQVDASISYIIDKKTVRISEQEKKIDSPFNTYKYPGLPLGPICNPGLESIKAAINPQPSDYWYYLSVPEEKVKNCPECTEGGTVFSKTLPEHNLAKAKYLK